MSAYLSRFLERLNARDSSLNVLIECSSPSEINQLIEFMVAYVYEQYRSPFTTPLISKLTFDFVELIRVLLKATKSRHSTMLCCIALIQQSIIKDRSRFMCMSELHEACSSYDPCSPQDYALISQIIDCIVHPSSIHPSKISLRLTSSSNSRESYSSHLIFREPSEGDIVILDLLSTLVQGRDEESKFSGDQTLFSSQHPSHTLGLGILFESDSVRAVQSHTSVLDLILETQWDVSLYPALLNFIFDLAPSPTQSLKLSHKVLAFLHPIYRKLLINETDKSPCSTGLPSWALASLLKTSLIYCQVAGLTITGKINNLITVNIKDSSGGDASKAFNMNIHQVNHITHPKARTIQGMSSLAVSKAGTNMLERITDQWLEVTRLLLGITIHLATPKNMLRDVIPHDASSHGNNTTNEKTRPSEINSNFEPFDPSVILCMVVISTRYSFQLVHIIRYYLKDLSQGIKNTTHVQLEKCFNHSDNALEEVDGSDDNDDNVKPRPVSSLSFIPLGVHDVLLLIIVLSMDTMHSLVVQILTFVLISFCERPDTSDMVAKMLETLIMLPGMDRFGPSFLRLSLHLIGYIHHNRHSFSTYLKKYSSSPLTANTYTSIQLKLLHLARKILICLFESQPDMRGEILAACFSNLANEVQLSTSSSFNSASLFPTISMRESESVKKMHGNSVSYMANLHQDRLSHLGFSRLAIANAQCNDLYCSTLEYIIHYHVHLVVPFTQTILEWLPYLPLLARNQPVICERLLDSVLPLVRVHPLFHDTLLMLLEKLLASRSPVPCAWAHHGLSTLLTKQFVDHQVENEIFANFMRSLKSPLVIRLPLYISILNALREVENTMPCVSSMNSQFHTVDSLMTLEEQEFLAASNSVSNPSRSLVLNFKHLVLSLLVRYFDIVPGIGARIDLTIWFEDLETIIRPRESLVHITALWLAAIHLFPVPDDQLMSIWIEYVNQCCDFRTFVVPHIMGLIPTRYSLGSIHGITPLDHLGTSYANTHLSRIDSQYAYLHLNNPYFQNLPSSNNAQGIEAQCESNIPSSMIILCIMPSYLLLAESMMQDAKRRHSFLFDKVFNEPVAVLKALQMLEIRSAMMTYSRCTTMATVGVSNEDEEQRILMLQNRNNVAIKANISTTTIGNLMGKGFNFEKHLQSLNEVNAPHPMLFSLDATMFFLSRFAYLGMDEEEYEENDANDHENYQIQTHSQDDQTHFENASTSHDHNGSCLDTSYLDFRYPKGADCCPSIHLVSDLLDIVLAYVKAWHRGLLLQIDKLPLFSEAHLGSPHDHCHHIWIPSLIGLDYRDPSSTLTQLASAHGCKYFLCNVQGFCQLLKCVFLTFQVMHSTGPDVQLIPSGAHSSPYLDALHLAMGGNGKPQVGRIHGSTLEKSWTKEEGITDTIKRSRHSLVQILEHLFYIIDQMQWNVAIILQSLSECFDQEEVNDNSQEVPVNQHSIQSQLAGENTKWSKSNEKAFTLSRPLLGLYFARVLCMELESSGGLGINHLSHFMKLVSLLSQKSKLMNKQHEREREEEDEKEMTIIMATCDLILDQLARFPFTQFSVTRLFMSFVLQHYPDPVWTIRFAILVAKKCCTEGVHTPVLEEEDHFSSKGNPMNDLERNQLHRVTTLRICETPVCRMQSLDLCLKYMVGFLQQHCIRNLDQWLEMGPEQAMIVSALQALIHTSLPLYEMTFTVWLKLVLVSLILYAALAKFLGHIKTSKRSNLARFERGFKCRIKQDSTYLLSNKSSSHRGETENDLNSSGWLARILLFSIQLRHSIQSKRSLFSKRQETRIPALLARIDSCEIILRQQCEWTSGVLRNEMSNVLKRLQDVEGSRQNNHKLSSGNPNDTANEQSNFRDELLSGKKRGRRNKHILRSRNRFIDRVLQEEDYWGEEDDYADLEDFIDPVE